MVPGHHFCPDQLLLLLTIIWSELLEDSPRGMGFTVMFWKVREFNDMGMGQPWLDALQNSFMLAMGVTHAAFSIEKRYCCSYCSDFTCHT